jgi:hypothetical protein
MGLLAKICTRTLCVNAFCTALDRAGIVYALTAFEEAVAHGLEDEKLALALTTAILRGIVADNSEAQVDWRFGIGPVAGVSVLVSPAVGSIGFRILPGVRPSVRSAAVIAARGCHP